jgi:hypothetical protein
MVGTTRTHVRAHLAVLPALDAAVVPACHPGLVVLRVCMCGAVGSGVARGSCSRGTPGTFAPARSPSPHHGHGLLVVVRRRLVVWQGRVAVPDVAVGVLLCAFGLRACMHACTLAGRAPRSIACTPAGTCMQTAGRQGCLLACMPAVACIAIWRPSAQPQSKVAACAHRCQRRPDPDPIIVVIF